MSRWVELYATSPSGKTLFMCKMCGRISPSPDKTCPTPPSVVSYKQILPCIVLEELASVMTDAVEQRKGAPAVTLRSPNHGVVNFRDQGGFAGSDFSVYVTLADERITKLIEDHKPVVNADNQEDRGRLGH